ncbi:glycogen debranching enzyme-like [Anneissia japonica]|uniref:glycogen debranching enzyme-like n=1 Tax=Anneissia japonica TaxID=1529436 RepID=UPI001425BA58|nr:glycogen debranching enzyme-like [Anneissia japonica]
MFEQVRQLQLNQNEFLDTTLHSLKKGWILHFVLGSSLQASKVRVFTNHPTTASKRFKRNEFYELAWESHAKSKCDASDNYCEVLIAEAGSYQYYFTLQDGLKIIGSGYFVVEPTLHLTSESDLLPLDCITIQTVLSKCLGPFSEWEDRLSVTRNTSYNMIHFTPIQKLGASNSSYSINNQNKLNPTITAGSDVTFNSIGELVEKMQTEWGVLSVMDVVWNHTSFDSQWLKEHPECGYNPINSPHLRPAFILDRHLNQFSRDVMEGRWESKGVPPVIDADHHIQAIQHVLQEHMLPDLKLWQFYQVDVSKIVEEFYAHVKDIPYTKDDDVIDANEVVIIQDPKFKRYGCTIDMDIAGKVFHNNRSDLEGGEDIMVENKSKLKSHLEKLNKHAETEVKEDLRLAVNSVMSHVYYHYVNPSGPRVGKVTTKNPLVPKYFLYDDFDDNFNEELLDSDEASCFHAHHGWIMGDSSGRDFASPESKAYLRRDVIVWGDSVKLRYGQKPSDCPYLWNHMLKYTEMNAKIFHGFRIDNCHSTPVHVAEYLLDAARSIQPDLYVIAELFTQSEEMDNIYVNRLGINSLIREALNAYNSHEQGRLVYRYGGNPVGSFLQPPVRPLTSSVAHALLMDVTHDNPSPIEKRSVYDMLPSAGLVAMASCASGSSRGYDELVPHHIHVVKEKRLYPRWNEDCCSSAEVNLSTGIIAAKKALNNLHQTLGYAGFNQVYVDQVDESIVAVTRHCPNNHQSVILVARTSFQPPSNPGYTGYVPPLCIPGVVDEIVLEAKMVQKKGSSGFKKNNNFVNGLSEYRVEMQEHIPLFSSNMVELTDGGEMNSPVQEVDFIDFPPGSVIAFRISLNPVARMAVQSLRSCVAQFGYRVRTLSGNSPRSNCDFMSIAEKLTLGDMNQVLYHCENEEKDDGKGGGLYHIPGYGNTVYCGIQGFMSILSDIHKKNDLGHPLCKNLRDGDWMAGYTANRLKWHPSTRELGKWFENAFEPLKHIPRYLIPSYFDAILAGAHSALLNLCWKKMTPFVAQGSSFVKALALGSVQMCCIVKTAPLPKLSPALADVPTIVEEDSGKQKQNVVSMAAGLPHFSSGFMRSWGRDTFIAFRGLLLLTGRFDEAKYIILAFAGTVRHGLIPNLLGGGQHARYNCRDAVWWWLQCIQDYCSMAPDGRELLTCKVSRMYPKDCDEAQPAGFVDQDLSEVIQECLQRHAHGISFRERHAGTGLDVNMTDKGFDVCAGIDPQTGFPFGGSEWNCGTWMDKVGESDWAGNRGHPATPRNGSAIEIVGLCKSAVKWLKELSSQGHYPFNYVQIMIDGKLSSMTYAEWDKKIQQNFENKFWISVDADREVDKMINQSGIYKDTVGATQFWADYQLRPNYPIAMVVAPELFTPANAWTAIQMAEKSLLGPLGMKTLDKSDWAYNGIYDNGYDGPDKNTARGFNYHLGPEWIWPTGYFLRAKLHFSKLVLPPSGQAEVISTVQQTLIQHHQALEASPWRGLAELTNEDGAYCKDSCPTQAWSMSCILEVLYDLDQMIKTRENIE